MPDNFSPNSHITKDADKLPEGKQPEWVFWIFGAPQRPRPQPFTKCLIHSDEIVFETHPSSPIPLYTIEACKMNSSSSGFSYNLNISISLKQIHPVFGKSLYFVLVNPLLAMWGNDRASTTEYQSFVQVVNTLKAGETPSIATNPYYRAYLAQGAKVSNQDIEDAYNSPTPVKRPNIFLVILLIIIVSGIMIFLLQRL